VLSWRSSRGFLAAGAIGAVAVVAIGGISNLLRE
jgi:hypothetical protein